MGERGGAVGRRHALVIVLPGICHREKNGVLLFIRKELSAQLEPQDKSSKQIIFAARKLLVPGRRKPAQLSQEPSRQQRENVYC